MWPLQHWVGGDGRGNLKEQTTGLRERVSELREEGEILVDFDDGHGACPCKIQFKIGADGAALDSMLGGCGFAGAKDAESCLFCRCPANKFASEEEFEPKTSAYLFNSAHLPHRGEFPFACPHCDTTFESQEECD
jgi:hypothetical protein